ncbi:hypothetical protein E8E13_002460 [Curvularia kusanoi]|uniref:BTB domain-containing protein n=1 Tax=Curvularia kusanoi TaxID=90978 RepID=A0A9P4W9I2_CURKU|nr:hypothetical protein E8E13_002460 [Curvularia kusanoi]
MSATSANAAAQPPGGIVTVQVGNGVNYNVHRTLLVSNSDYFERVFNGKWREANDGVVRIEDVESDVFNIFIDWLDSKSIKLRGSQTVDAAVVDALILGDYLLATAFTDAVKRYVLNKYRSVRHFSVM